MLQRKALIHITLIVQYVEVLETLNSLHFPSLPPLIRLSICSGSARGDVRARGLGMAT